MRKKLQKQSFADILQSRCSKKFCKFDRKTPVLESLFNKVAGLKKHMCFPVKSATFLRTGFL